MRRAIVIVSAWLALAAVAGSASAAARDARQPVVVELYTAQGCSSCVAANSLLDELADKPDVLALTLAVDYWDYLGWTDTFAKPEFSARQRAYMRRMSSREVYTPQIVVDGKALAAGADRDKVMDLVREARKGPRLSRPRLRFLRRSRVEVGWGRVPPGGADVWLVRYESGVQEVSVKRGENRGQTLAERNVVRQLVRLGPWRGRTRTFALPPPEEPGLETLVLVQQAKGGRILRVLQK